MNGKWDGFCFSFAALLFGISGLIFKLATVPFCLFLIVFGLLGVIFYGMPIWKRFLNFLGAGAMAFCEYINGKDITKNP